MADWIHALNKRTKRGEFLANVIMMVGGRMGSLLIILCALPVFTRLFSPEQFGLFDTARALAAIVVSLGSISYEKAIVLPEDEKEAKEICALALLLLMVVAGGSMICAFFFDAQLQSLMGSSEVLVWQIGIPVYIFAFGLRALLREWITRGQDFGGLSLGTVAGAVVHAAIPIIAGLSIVAGAEWLLYGLIGESIFAILVTLSLNRSKFIVFGKQDLKLASLLRRAREYSDFALYRTPHALIEALGGRIIFLLLNVYVSVQTVGFYGVAERLSALPCRIVTPAMRQVFYGKAARAHDRSKLGIKVVRALDLQVGVVIPVLVLAVPACGLFVPFVLGDKWSGAVPYVQLLLILNGVRFTTSWLDRMYVLARRQRLALVQQGAFESVRIVGMILILRAFGDPLLTVAFYVILDVLFNIYWLTMAFYVAKMEVSLLPRLLQGILVRVVLWTCTGWVVLHALPGHWDLLLLAVGVITFVGHSMLQLIRKQGLLSAPNN